MELLPFVGENVCVKLYRHHHYKEYHGRLTDVNKNRICLLIDNRSVWITKPSWYRDNIKLEE